MRYWPFLLIIGVIFIGCTLICDSDDSDAYSASGSGTYADPYSYWSGSANEANSLFQGNDKWFWQSASIQINAVRYGGEYGSEYDAVSGISPTGQGAYVDNSPRGNLIGNFNSVTDYTITINMVYEEFGFEDFQNVTIHVRAPPTYTVAWNNWDGTRLETDYNVPQGTTPSYNSATPTRAWTAQYAYTFSGWYPGVGPIYGDTTYTAQFSQTTRTYTVTWKNWDGTVLETDYNVPYGTTPTYNSATPTRASTAQYSYTFTGWSPTVGGIGGDTIYTAQFSQTTRTYTVTWKNWDDTTLETDNNVAYGTTPTYDGTTPTRTADAQYTYTFSGWTPTVSAVTGNATYTAQYSTTVNNYTVTWKNWDDTTLETDLDVPYGTTPTYDSATPTKSADAQYTYAFSGWSPTVGAITGNTTYAAQFTSTLRSYTITWEDWDGTTLETDTDVPYGTTPTYDSATPTRSSTAQYIYSFDGWNPIVASVTGDATYTAQYAETLRSYTITWKNWDGTTLEIDTTDYGETPTYDSATPTKPSTAQYTFTFSGWSPTVAAVTGDATYTAQYSSTVNEYTITWLNWDETVLETDQNVPYGTTPTYDGSTPTKPSTVEYVYTFTGWNPAVSTVTGDTVYTAQFSSGPRPYTITWKNWDNTTLETDSTPYGTIPTYDGVTPTKPSTSEYMYTFTGWSPSVVAVTGDATYTAQFSATALYTVIWKNWDGTVLETDVGVPDGTLPTYDGATPTRPDTPEYTYEFNGWSPTVSLITEDTEYTAQYTATNLYTVVWRNWDGTALETDTGVPDGTTPTYDGATPTRPDTESYTYTFSGWDPAVGPISGYTEYTAQYSSTPLYLVRWLNWDGSVINTDRIPVGTTPSYSGEIPERPMTIQYQYAFTGWSPAIVPITEDTDYTAQYSQSYRDYTYEDWTYNILDSGTARVIGYDGSGGIVEIPYSMDDRIVTNIGDALKNDSSVTGVVIPMAVSSIDADAFYGTGITQVLNLSNTEITGTSYGLNNAAVYTSVPGWFYISDVTYMDKEPDDSSLSDLVRIIPLLIIIGVVVMIIRGRVEE